MPANHRGGSSGGNLGIHVPDADPGQLESAANELRSVAFGLNHIAGRLQVASRVPEWHGVASFQFADTVTTAARGVHRGADAMLAGARIVDRLAHDLREVKRKTKAAVRAAHEAEASRHAAEIAAQDSREEAVRQRLAADDVQARINVRQLAGDPAPADVLAQRTAAAASVNAYRDAARFDDKGHQALADLTEARAAGQRANDHYQHLARAAARAIAGLASNTPTAISVSIPTTGGNTTRMPAGIPPVVLHGALFNSEGAEGEEGEESELDPRIKWSATAVAKAADAAGGAEAGIGAVAEGLAAEAVGPLKALSSLARPLAPVGPVAVLGVNKAEGQSWKQATARTGITTAGAMAGMAGAGVACGAVTFGTAAAFCGIAGGVAGGFLGEHLGGVIFGE